MLANEAFDGTRIHGGDELLPKYFLDLEVGSSQEPFTFTPDANGRSAVPVQRHAKDRGNRWSR